MKKLLVVLLGLASLNVYANGCGGEYQPATGTCRIIDSSGRQILYNVGKPQSSNSDYSQNQPSVVNIDVPSKYGAWAVNPKTGISADVINAPSLEIAKEGLLSPVSKGDEMLLVKYLLQSETAASPLLKDNLAKGKNVLWNRAFYWTGRTGSLKKMSSFGSCTM